MHALLMLLVVALSGADVFRWTDADGQTHYSDRPQAGAERVVIDVQPTSGTSIGAAGSRVSVDDPSAETTLGTGGYLGLKITSPEQEEVLWNIEGQLSARAEVQPALQAGHSLQFYLDGRMEQAAAGASQVQFSGVYRGEHSMRVAIVGPQGTPLVETPQIRFFVRQTSIANPVNPVTSRQAPAAPSGRAAP